MQKPKNRILDLTTLRWTLLVIPCSLLIACGGSGSGGDVSVAPPSPTVTPPPPTTAPINTSASDGVFTGEKTNSDNQTSQATALISPDKHANIISESESTSIVTVLNPDQNGDIETEGTLYSATAGPKSVSINGHFEDTEYTLEISQNNQLLSQVVLVKNADDSNAEPVLNGYYELLESNNSSIALIIKDGQLEANNDDNCHVNGDITILSDNVYAIEAEISDVAPFLCTNAGDFDGLASVINTTNDPALLFSLQSHQKSLALRVPKISETPKFAALTPGIYESRIPSEGEAITLAVSIDGDIRGSVANNHFAGYFDAQSNFMGGQYVIHGDNVRIYNRSQWVIQPGFITIVDRDWQRLFEQPSSLSSEKSETDDIVASIGTYGDDGRSYQIDFALHKKLEIGSATPFNELIGHYVHEGSGTDLVIDSAGQISGKQHHCDVTGTLSEVFDGDIQELRLELNRENCPDANSFSKDGEYNGFGFNSVFTEEGYSSMSFFLTGLSVEGPITQIISLSSNDKQ